MPLSCDSISPYFYDSNAPEIALFRQELIKIQYLRLKLMHHHHMSFFDEIAAAYPEFGIGSLIPLILRFQQAQYRPFSLWTRQDWKFSYAKIFIKGLVFFGFMSKTVPTCQDLSRIISPTLIHHSRPLLSHFFLWMTSQSLLSLKSASYTAITPSESWYNLSFKSHSFLSTF